MKNGKYNIAIVGYGGMGSQHAKFLQNTKLVEVAGIFDIKKQRVELAISNNLKTYNSLKSVLEDNNVDIVLIATPNHTHKDIAIKSMRAGKHIICEKPAALNSKELQEMIDVSEETGMLFVVDQNRRWDEDFSIIKDIYEKGEIGKVFNIESRVHGSRGIPGDWRKVKKFGGGMMLDWGVHLVDRLLWMVDEKVSKVYCEHSYVLGEECEDGFKMKLIFENGLTSTIEVGTSNYVQLPNWYINGTSGSAVINNWDKKGQIVKVKDYKDKDAKPVISGAGLTKTMAPRDEKTLDFIEIPIKKSDIRGFYNNVINTLEGIEEIVVKNSEVMRVMKLMELANKSNELGQVLVFEK